jgi:histidinol-phosphatase (PHP family)
MKLESVSVHGGHSGQFCNHAKDDLEAIIEAYIRKGFAWVGITEHMPPAEDRFRYTEERSAGLTAEALRLRFAAYFQEARRLQRAFADRLEIFIGFETEATTGSFELAETLVRDHQPDYLVGGVHHVDDIPIDTDADDYARAVQVAGTIENLYCRYFDLQYQMIERLQPAVVAHFDLVRIFDPDYRGRWKVPAIRDRINRNLERIGQLDLILDFNVAALRKGAAEPYLSRELAVRALEMGIAVVPADDSHGVDSAGAFIAEGIATLDDLGVKPPWRRPVSSMDRV